MPKFYNFSYLKTTENSFLEENSNSENERYLETKDFLTLVTAVSEFKSSVKLSTAVTPHTEDLSNNFSAKMYLGNKNDIRVRQKTPLNE